MTIALSFWFVLAIAAGFGGYALYLFSLRRHLVRPSRALWLIWSTTTAVEAATYAAVNPGAAPTIVFMVAAAACLAIAVVLWRHSVWARPDTGELICIGAVALWLGFREAFWAHILVVAAVPLSFWPT